MRSVDTESSILMPDSPEAKLDCEFAMEMFGSCVGTSGVGSELVWSWFEMTLERISPWLGTGLKQEHNKKFRGGRDQAI